MESPQSARSQTSDRHQAVLMIDTEDFNMVRSVDDALPPLGNRADQYGALEDTKWNFQTYPIQRVEMKARWNSWSDCRVNTKQCILN